MGKSLGTKPSGKGPGLQKRTKLQRKYLTDSKAQVKRGKMSDLDFGVEQAPKLSRKEAETGLKGDTSAAARAPAETTEPASKTAKTAHATKASLKTVPAARTKKAVAAEKATEEAAAAAAAAASHAPREWQAYSAEGKGDRKQLAERVGAVEYTLAVNNIEDFRSAQDFAMQKTLEKKRKKCAPC